MARVQGAAGKAVRILGRILPGLADELLQGLFVEPTLGMGAGQSLNAAFLALFQQSAGMGGSLRDDVGLTGAILLGVRADGSLAATYTAFAAAGMAAVITPTFQPLATAAHLEPGAAGATYPVTNPAILITNPGFETYPVSPGTPTAWASTFDASVTLTREEANTHAGYALRLTANNNAPVNGAVQQNLVGPVAGAVVKVRAWHRTNGSATARGRLKIRNTTDSLDVQNVVGTTGITTWEALAAEFTPLAGKAYSIEVKFDNAAATLAGDAVLWDDLSITNGPPDLSVHGVVGGSYRTVYAAPGAAGMAAGAYGTIYVGPGGGTVQAGMVAPTYTGPGQGATLPSYAAAAVAPGPGAAAQASGIYGTAYAGPGGGTAQAGMLMPAYAAPGAAATIPAGALGAAYAAPGAGAIVPAAPIAITVNPFGAAATEVGKLGVLNANVTPTNILVNPSMETYTTSPGAPDNWFINQGTRVTITKELSILHCGDNACRMTRIVDALSTPGIGQIIAGLSGSTTYYFFAWVYAFSNASQQAGLVVTDSGGTTIASFTSAALPLGVWTKLFLRFNVAGVANKFHVVHAGGTLGDVLIADCSGVTKDAPADLGVQAGLGPLNVLTGDRIASKDVFTRTDKTASTCNEDTNRDTQDIRVQNFTGVSIRDGYVGWDLTGMPAGATLVAATLKVNVVTAPGAAADVDLYALANADEDWNETTLKCSTAPASSGSAMQRINFPASTGQKSFVLNATVLARLQARMGVGVASLLFRMVGTTINDDVTFDDKESGASVGPRLSLHFTT